MPFGDVHFVGMLGEGRESHSGRSRPAGTRVDAVKTVLRSKGITYRELGAALGLSEASVKRIFAQKSFSLKRLEEICQLLEMTIYELAKLATDQDRQPATTPTIEQETALAKEPQLLAYFYLLINGWTASRIKKKLRMTEAQSTRALNRLHRLKLIELFSKKKVRLLTARTIAWRKAGPVRRLYENRVRQEFLGTDFDRVGGVMKFETAELSESSMTILSRRIEQLVREADGLAKLDMASPPDRKHSVGLLVAFRPWVFTLLADR